ncbi:hypothetical protein WK39_29725 [Burkholderia cepacia]|uniref:HNH endonuclease n=1 Tax=Burkholderia cepacia TaxID=292 RepID=UPI0007523188|nr:hypothetical protein [Burkholderia cepacia]KVS50180.1 hypothetical protein WK39_29725 [Burkholderia cepacia]KVS62874.1 hypothetical protein WK40_17810 [Burkholderia cepacia]
MLFPYVYVPHRMEKMQAFIDFIFFEVWCNASNGAPFGLDLFAAYPELHEVMQLFFYSDTKGADFFYGHVERIYGLFTALSPAEVWQFQQWYRGNNDVAKVCAKDVTNALVRYAEIEGVYPELTVQLASFFKGLYSQSLLGLVALKDKIGDIDDHYLAFMQANSAGKCPFCGINDLLGEYHSKREAYDHYLPKALYPFNSINFRNLVPACHQCNSSYKTSKDVAHAPKDPAGNVRRRKFFYPYSTDLPRIEISVGLGHADVDVLQPEDIDLQFGPPALSEEIDAWRDIYGVDERYKAKFLSENDGKYWITQVLDEWKEGGKLPEEFLRTLARQADKKPFAEANFLKKPFLEACHTRGILDGIG